MNLRQNIAQDDIHKSLVGKIDNNFLKAIWDLTIRPNSLVADQIFIKFINPYCEVSGQLWKPPKKMNESSIDHIKTNQSFSCAGRVKTYLNFFVQIKRCFSEISATIQSTNTTCWFTHYFNCIILGETLKNRKNTYYDRLGPLKPF